MQLADVWRCAIAYALHEPATSLRGSYLNALEETSKHTGASPLERPSSSCRTVLLPSTTDWMVMITERLCKESKVLRTQYEVHASSLPDTRTARACQTIRSGVYIHTCSLYLRIHLPVHGTSCATCHTLRIDCRAEVAADQLRKTPSYPISRDSFQNAPASSDSYSGETNLQDEQRTIPRLE